MQDLGAVGLSRIDLEQDPIRTSRLASSLAVISVVLASLNIILPWVVLHSGGRRLEEANLPGFLNSSVVVLVVCSLILVLGSVLTIISHTRSLGLGVLASASGLTVLEWSGISESWYSRYGSIFVGSGTEPLLFVMLVLAAGLTAVALIGIAVCGRAEAGRGRSSTGSMWFAFSAASAAGWLVFFEIYPYWTAFRSLQGVGLVLDLIGVVATVGPLVVLALLPVQRSAAAGVVASWSTVALLFSAAFLTDAYRTLHPPYQWWKVFYPIPLVVAVLVFGLVGVSRLSAKSGSRSESGGAVGNCIQGHPLSAADSFCAICGSPRAVASATGSRGCPSGHEVPPEDQFCSECGAPVALTPLPSGAVTSYASPPRSSQSFTQIPVGAAAATNGMAIAALVCGVTGFFFLAIPFGFVGRKQIRQSNGTQTGDGMALAGIILGFVSLGFVLLYVVFIIIVLVWASGQNNGY